MARLTRNLLKALGIEDQEKQDEIIAAHRETVDPLKEERDELKEKADQVEGLQKQVEDLKKEIEEAGESPYKAQWEETKKAFEDYKKDIEAKEAKAKKAEAYRKLLQEAKVSDKRLDAIMRVSDVDGIKFDDKGEVEGKADVLKDIQNKWSDFIVTDGKDGQPPATPPAGGGQGGTGTSRAAQVAARFYGARYGTNTNGGDNK